MFGKLLRSRMTILALITMPLDPVLAKDGAGGFRGPGHSSPPAGGHSSATTNQVHVNTNQVHVNNVPSAAQVHVVQPNVVTSHPNHAVNSVVVTPRINTANPALVTPQHVRAVSPAVVNNINNVNNITNTQVVKGSPQTHYHGAVGIHSASPAVTSRPVIGGNNLTYTGHGVPVAAYSGPIHVAGPHWNNYHQAFVGNQPVRLAWSGYRPSYYYHNWYNGSWGGHPWGWGWGYQPGLTFGFNTGGVGLGLSSGWGYPAYYGPYGRYGYWGRPLGWGFGGWGLGTVAYSSGYYPYYNPYYVAGTYPTVVYNYSTPIPVAVQQPANFVASNQTLVDPSQSSGAAVQDPIAANAFDTARELFKQGDYMSALTRVDEAIARSPSDAVMHEFRSLVLFALRDYKQSAAVIHSVLAVGPGWDWTTMSGLYPDPQVYSNQLRFLEQYTRERPRSADAHFLLAYHDMIASRRDEAAAELQQVVTLMPTDRLAGELLTMVRGPAQTQPASPTGGTGNSLGGDPNLNPPPSPAPQTESDPPPIDQNLLPGTWTASRNDGSNFRLAMTSDGKFSWKFSTPNQKGEEFSGTYSVDGPVLTLQRKEGGALAGVTKFDDDQSMNFKMVGGPAEDPGLDFRK